MRNLITTFVCALTLSTTFAFANNNETRIESKIALPVMSAAIETPAPQDSETVVAYSEYSPAQKAAIVELLVSVNDTKAESKLALPASTPAIETPAPEKKKTVNEYAKYTPTQKAAIVELKVTK
jgi:hypothetical protein